MTRNKNSSSLLIAVVFGCIGLSLFSFQLSFVLSQWLTYVLLFSVFVLFLSEKYTSVHKFINKYQLFLIVLLSSLTVGTLFRENLSAQWGAIDDHEIMKYLGEDKKFSFYEIPQTIMTETEVGSFGKSLRYRPAYYLLRLTETALWGNNPHLWYGFRMLILVVSLSIFWKLLSRLFGFIPSGLFVVYVMTFSMWSDMFARLGPAETYTVLSFAFFVWAMTEIINKTLKNESVRIVPIIVWTLATIVSVGVKENFVLLLLPNLLIIGYLAFKRRVTPLLATSFLMSTASILLVAAAVIIPLLNTGSDIYGQSVAPVSRFSILITGMKHSDSKKMIFAGLILAGITGLQLFQKKKNQKIIRATLLTFGLVVTYHFIFISQYVFYNGGWPNGTRYDFPGVLVTPFFYLTIISFAYFLLKQETIPKQILRGLKYGSLIGFVCLIVMKGFVDLRVRVERNAETTIGFTKRITEIASVAKNNPTYALVIESGNPWDFEPIHAYEKFMRAYGVKNTMHLRLNGYSEESVNPGLEKQLTRELEQTQKLGNKFYQPLPEKLENCYSILLTKPSTDDCEVL